MDIVELRSEAERRAVLPILSELYPSLSEERYAALMAEMAADGYRQFAVRHETGEIVAVAGVAVHVNLYDLVVTEGARSKGYGELLLDHVEGVARSEGCETTALACGLEREGALRLYERKGYEKPSYAMRKALR